MSRTTSNISAGDLVFPQNIITVDSKNEPVKRYGTWSEVDDAEALGGSYLESSTTGDKLLITFRGTVLWVRFKFGRHSGIASVAVDGSFFPDMDLYEATSVFKLVCVAHGLSYGIHTAEVSVSGSKGFPSDDYNVDIDAFVYEMKGGGLQVLAMIEGVVPVTGKVDVTTLTPKIYLEDTFEPATLGWVHSGTGSLTRITTRYVKDGACMQLTTGVTAGDKCYAIRKLGLPLYKRLSVSAHFTLPSNGRYLYIGGDGLTNPSYTGVFKMAIGVRYDIVNSKWQYISSAGAWTDVPDGAQVLEKDDDSWHYFELIMKITATGYFYESMICDSSIFKIDEAVQLTLDFTPISSVFNIGLETNVNAAVDAYIDLATIKELSPF